MTGGDVLALGTLDQFALGLGVIAATVVVEVLAIVAMNRAMGPRARAGGPMPPMRAALILAGATLGLMVAMIAAVWLWALAFLWLGLFETTEEALYFALVCFTTVGFGDVVLGLEWRLLSGLAAANGLLIFGLSTAYLVEVLKITRVHSPGPWIDD